VLAALGLVVPLLVVVALLLRWRRRAPVQVLAAAAPAPPAISGDADPIAALDALLTELERLAEKLEAAAASLEGVR